MGTKQCQGTPIILPPLYTHVGRKECRGRFFPAHYKGNDVINRVILSAPLFPRGGEGGMEGC